MKGKIYHFLNTSRAGGVLIGSLIFLSIVLFSLETEFANSQELVTANILIAIIFGLEYILRIWSADYDNDIKAPRLKYITSFYGIVDLIAFLPVLILPLFSGTLLLRLLRILRLLQLLKIRALSDGLMRVSRALKDAKSELIITTLMSSLLIFLGAVIMYFVEGSSQPEQFGSIPRALWWSMATLTTVGYGDVYPITSVGKVVASLIAIIGIAAVAMPSGILAAAFMRAKK